MAATLAFQDAPHPDMDPSLSAEFALREGTRARREKALLFGGLALLSAGGPGLAKAGAGALAQLLGAGAATTQAAQVGAAGTAGLAVQAGQAYAAFEATKQDFIRDALDDAGIDLSDPAAAHRYFQENPTLGRDILKDAFYAAGTEVIAGRFGKAAGKLVETAAPKAGALGAGAASGAAKTGAKLFLGRLPDYSDKSSNTDATDVD